MHPFLPTRYWLAFVDLFRDPILWDDVVSGLVVQLGYLLVFGLAAWASFSTKDITDCTALTRSDGYERSHRWPRAGRRGAAAGGLAGSTPSTASSAARVTGVPGSSPWLTAAPGQTSWTRMLTAPVQRGRVHRGDHLVAPRPHRGPQRPVRGLVPGVEPAEQVAVRHQLLAGGRAAAGQLAAERGLAGAVVRRAEGEHPPGLAVAAVVADPEPGDHAAGGVADHVDRRRVRSRPGPARPPRPGARPRRPGRRCRRPAGAPRVRRGRPRAGPRPADPATRPGRRSRGPAAPGPAGPAAPARRSDG